MAAALFRRGPGLCVRCIHRELCRLVWRPQTAQFSSKPSDRKQPRITHFKKAKPQPAVDIPKLLEQLYSQKRPGTVSPAGKARPAQASSTPTKPPDSSSTNVSTSSVPPLSKTASASVFPAASSLPEKNTATFKTATHSTQAEPASPTNTSSETPQQSVVDGPVEPTVDVAAEEVRPKSTDSGLVDASQTATVEPLIETTIEPSVETSTSALGILESKAAVAESTVEPTIDAETETVAQALQTNSTDSAPVNLSHTAKEEPLIETTVESTVEASRPPLENRAAESTVDATADAPAEEVRSNGLDSGVIDFTQTTKVEPLLETTVESSVEASRPPLDNRAAVAEGPVEPTVETGADTAADSLSHAALTQIVQESAALPLKNEIESTVESSSGNAAVEEGVNAAEEMNLESVTLNLVKALLESLKTDELLQTKSVLDEKAEKRLQELLVQTGIVAEYKAAAATENSAEAEREILTKVLSNWESLSEDLQELEGETGMLVKELLCHVPAVLSNTSTGVTTSVDSHATAPEPPVGANGNLLHVEEEKLSKEEAMTLESITLADVKAEVGSLEYKVLQEMKDALENEADVLAKKEKMMVETEREDVADFEGTIETEILTLDSISEAADALEAETSVILESMFGSEQGLKQPPDALLAGKKQDEAIVQEAEKQSREQDGSVVEAMSLESVTLAEVEASLGALENESLKETSAFLEEEAEILAGEKKVKVEDSAASEEMTEALTVESLSLPEADVLSKEENMEVEIKRKDVADFEDTIQAEILTLDSISEATDALETETSVILEFMFGSEQGLKQPPDALLIDKKQDEAIIQEAEKQSREQDGSVVEAMSLESVTLAEIEASLRALEGESLKETTAFLEEEAEILAGEKKVEVEDGAASEEMTEALTVESLSLPEADALSEALQTDALMEELLFSVPGHVAGRRENLQTGQEVVRENILDATVATRSGVADTVAAETDDLPAPPAQKEVLLGQEKEEQEDGAKPEDLEIQEGTGTHADLDPVQRLFLEKIREYNNMRRLSGEPVEMEPDYEKSLSEETAKLQRLYGGGDLSSFPQFTFTEPTMDKDSK